MEAEETDCKKFGIWKVVEKQEEEGYVLRGDPGYGGKFSEALLVAGQNCGGGLGSMRAT